MAQADIAVVLRDGASDGIARLQTANQGFDRSMEETSRTAQDYARRLEALDRSQAELAVSVERAKQEMNEARTAFRNAGDAANDEELTAAIQRYNSLRRELGEVSRAARTTQTELRNISSSTTGTTGTMGATTGGMAASAGLGTQLAQAGALSMIGDVVGDAASQLATSAFGSTAGNYVSSTLSMGGMGAAIGSIIPGIGTAVGAAIGAGIGLITAKMDELGEKDDAYRDMVQQTFDEVITMRSEMISSGSELAAGREMDLISFGTLLGDQQVGADYLGDIVDMANMTPFLYEDLKSMSKTLSTYGFGVDRLIPALTNIGDAGSAIGMSTDDMSMVATAIGRMENTDKTSLEYINLLTERGIDAIGMIAQREGATVAEVYEGISAGEYSGKETAALVLDQLGTIYGGSMALQSQTYTGMSSTLEGMNNEMALAGGEGYNTMRMTGMEAQINYLTGEGGEQMKEANRLIGEFEASLINQQEELMRNSVSSVMSGVIEGDWDEQARERLSGLMSEYDSALLADDGAEMGRVIMEAQALAMAEYNETEGMQIKMQSEKDLLAGVQGAMSESYYLYGYDMGIEFSKGYLSSGVNELIAGSAVTTTGPMEGADPYAASSYQYSGFGYAHGLNTVPYNGFPAVLHQGERVMTASQVREADSGSAGGGININIANLTVREEADVQKVAEVLQREISAAMAIAAR